jgi:ribose 5-phosphate isomerase A
MSETLKQQAAEYALRYLEDDSIVGIGTGSTVNYFIKALASHAHRIEGTVASSKQSEALLKQCGIPVFPLTAVSQVSTYIDGVDEINSYLQMVKGGGGALTGEKIVAQAAKRFIAIAHEAKHVKLLGRFPVAVEVIPMARSLVAREIVKLGGDPVYREGFSSDYGNIILDVHHLSLSDPQAVEQQLNQIPGVVCHGIFAKRRADVCVLACTDSIHELKAE